MYKTVSSFSKHQLDINTVQTKQKAKTTLFKVHSITLLIKTEVLYGTLRLGPQII